MSDAFAAPDAKPNALSVRWRWEPWHDKKASLEQGRPIYVDREWVTIRDPGDQTWAIDHFATDEEKRQHRASLAAWKADNASEGIVGTRLEQWPQMSRAMVEELKHFGIRTVEQLAALSEASARGIPRGMAMREQAIAWVKTAKEGAPVQALAAEMKALKEELESLKRERDQALKELDKATAPEKGRR